MNKKKYTQEQKDWLIANWSKLNAEECAKHLNVSVTAVHYLAKRICEEREPRNDIIHRVYKEEESEFLKAIIAFRSVHGRVPSLLEAFRIARELGWSK